MVFNRAPPLTKRLSVIFLVYTFAVNISSKFLPVFFKQHIASVFLISVLTALKPLIPVFFDIPVTNVMQRIGERIVLFTGMLALVLPGFLYITTVPLLLAGGRIFQGVSKVTLWNAAWSLNMQAAENTSDSASLSVFLVGVYFSGIVAPVVGGYFISMYGYTLAFVVWIVGVAVAALLLYRYIGIEHIASPDISIRSIFAGKTYADQFQSLRVYWDVLKLPFLLVFLYEVVTKFLWLAVPLFLDALGADLVTMGFIFGVASLPNIVQYLFGRAGDAYGRPMTVAALSLLLVPVLMGMGFAVDVFVVGGLFLVAMLFRTGIHPQVHAIFDVRVPDEKKSELLGFFELFKHIGQAVGPVMAGVVATYWSLAASFYAAAFAAFLLFTTALYTIFAG